MREFMKNNKETYRNTNIPNPTIRNQFLSRASPIVGVKKTTILFEAPYFLDKMIEFQATNYSGYSEEIKSDKEISEETLWKYLEFKEKSRKEALNEFRDNQILSLVYKIKQQEDIIKNVPTKKDIYNIESKIVNLNKSVENLIEEKDFYKNQYEELRNKVLNC